jgi:hypothetical protein
MIATSPIPIYLGGGCDVLTFRQNVTGVTRVTAGLAGALAGQPPTALGNYELMMCTRSDEGWVAGMISNLATYTLQTPSNPMIQSMLGPISRPASLFGQCSHLNLPRPRHRGSRFWAAPAA